MKFVENTVIEFFDDERKSIGTERILWISPDKLQVVIIDLDNKSSLPDMRSYESLEESLSCNRARILEIDPYNIAIGLYEPSLKNLQSRDKAWNLIHEFVLNEPDIYDARLRNAMINDYIDRMEKER